MYNPPLRDAPYIFYVSLPSQADGNVMQNTPTIAAGDFKASKDGGALANLTTLPAVTPAASAVVKVTLSAAEMGADNVTVVCKDAAGAEWADVTVNIQTVSGWATASAVNDAGATTTVFDTDLTAGDADYYKSAFLAFTSGALIGQGGKISAYVVANGRITLATPLTVAPADNDEFVILGRSE